MTQAGAHFPWCIKPEIIIYTLSPTTLDITRLLTSIFFLIGSRIIIPRNSNIIIATNCEIIEDRAIEISTNTERRILDWTEDNTRLHIKSCSSNLQLLK